MNTVERNSSQRTSVRRAGAAERPWRHSSLAAVRSITRARRRRERLLACLALFALVGAWNATLQLDERVTPARMRLSHAVEAESELPTFALAL